MRKLLTFLAIVLCTTIAHAQTRTIMGKVVDQTGKPVPSATILLKGTKSGVSADADGSFKISAKTGDVLVVSAVNFSSKEAKITSANVISVFLNVKETQIDEVVVTAYGIKRSKSQLPYAAQQIVGEEISKTRTSNFVGNLSGKVAGLEIRQTNTLGGSTNVVLRGAKSFTGNNQALFVIDGVPFDNSNTNNGGQTTGRGGYDYGSAAADINPDDIESVTVLKGAAASALYGSRGFNGVILITTKKGGNKALGITINSGITTGSIDKSTFATYQKQYGGGYGLYYEDPSGYFLYRDPVTFQPVTTGGVLVVPTSEDASYGAPFDPTKMVYQWDAFDPTSPNFGKSKPWQAAANDPTTYFTKPTNFNNSIIIDGGNDKGTFKIGYTRSDEKGILPNSKLTKNILNFSSTYNITNKFTVGASINFNKIQGLGRYGTGYDAKNPATNFRQWWEVNVDVKDLEAAYFRTKKNVTWNWADPTDLQPIYWDNPYWDRYENYENDTRNRYFGNVNATYKVTDHLSVTGRIALDNYSEIQEERIAKGSIDVPNYSRYNRTFSEYNYDFLVNYDKDISRSLNVKGLLGSNIRKTTVSSIYATTNGGLVLPRVYALFNSSNPIAAPSESLTDREVDGYFGGATLTYKGFLALDGTFRRDISSTLPKGNNAYNYYGISGSFIFSKLLNDKISWLDYGKLRANYGEVGNDAPSYQLRDDYVNSTSFGNNSLYAVSTSKKNSELRPERTKNYEFGVEAQFLKNRLGFDVTYYNARTVDQILAVAVSTATGYSSKVVNSGTIKNQGVEVTLTGVPIKTKNFSWNVAINWTRNRNMVEELAPGIDNLQLATFQGGVSINAALGQPYGTIRGNDFVYTNGQRTIGANGRYLLSSASNNVIGNSNPDWIGGINNSFRYKNVTLSFLVDVRNGGQLFSLDLYYGLATGLYPETAGNNDLGNPLRSALSAGGGIVRDGVTADGKVNTKRVSAQNYGAYGYRYSPAAGFIYDASYVKLRELTLSYSIPKNILGKGTPFKGIDLSLVGRNLWLISKKLPYADPEETISSGNLQGYQGGAYPTTRTIGFNVKFKF